jgi:hypothetical protein
MLRKLLFFAALAVFVVALAARLAGHHEATGFAFWGACIAAAVQIERWRYKARNSGQGGEWQKTDERFVDPETGQTMQVFYNPRTGERRYERAADGTGGSA